MIAKYMICMQDVRLEQYTNGYHIFISDYQNTCFVQVFYKNGEHSSVGLIEDWILSVAENEKN